MTKLQLRHPRDEAPLRECKDQRFVGLVKQSFIAEATKLELRDQKNGKQLMDNALVRQTSIGQKQFESIRSAVSSHAALHRLIKQRG